MNVFEMSMSGAVLIVAVIVIRALTINRLPKKTFLILWGIVLFRLLVPFSLSSAFSIYTLIGQNTDFDALVQSPSEQVSSSSASMPYTSAGSDGSQRPEDIADMSHNDGQQADSATQNGMGTVRPIMGHEQGEKLLYNVAVFSGKSEPVRVTIWFVGMIVCTVYFAASYLRCRFEFQTSLPVEDTFAQSCLKRLQNYSRWRQVSIRQSDRVATPLTYGVFHPVILMPKDTDWENREQLQYVLLHEYVHICRYDALTKLIVICALCIHWFNPMVWIMYVLFNRDVEISCDESVVRRMGEASKKTYAMMLIQMEAARSGLAPFCNGLLSKVGKNAMEERITAIMKIRKKSMLAGIAAAVLVISVTTAFATSAAETKEKTAEKMSEEQQEKETAQPDTYFAQQGYEMLLDLQFEGYGDMSISEFRNKVWAATDTVEYHDLLERFFQDETMYTIYESTEGTDSNETLSFLYNVLGSLMDDQQSRSFGGYAVSDFPGASDNATLEYEVTLTILDADLLSVYEYDWARQSAMGDLNILKDFTTSDLRDEEEMKVYIDETIENISRMYGSGALRITVEYFYTPLGVMAVDDMEEWQKERRDEWDKIMAPYVPFGLTYRYHWDTDDYKMYFHGKEVRGIYDEGNNVWISEHAGIGKDIYDENATELFAVYESGKLVGLREATEQEMEEITSKRQAVTDEYKNGYKNEYQELREFMPATKEDYRNLFTLKTSDYQQKSIMDFDMELLDWCNENYDQFERIECDRRYNDYRVALTDEEKSFAALTVWMSGMENGAYVRSLYKQAPEQDVEVDINLPIKDQNGNASAWCSLYYSFSYHISDKEKVSVGERDERIGQMMDDIENYWVSSEMDEILGMTKSDMLDALHKIAAKNSNCNVTITIMDERTSFECMDERALYDEARQSTQGV